MNNLFNLYNQYRERSTVARRGATIATVLYFVLVALALWLTTCENHRESELVEMGSTLMISLGDSDMGLGENRSQPRSASPPSTPAPTPKVVEQLTDERSEIEHHQPPKQQEEVVSKQQTSPDDPVEHLPQREVNQRALFPGASTNQSTSQGDTQRGATQGSSVGSPNRESTLGDGLTGNYSLSGRTLIGSLPIPSYRSNSEGRVVINIMVDELGRVTSASLRAESSTTNNSVLINAAREAAMKARFSDSSEFLQGGTITYIFKMN